MSNPVGFWSYARSDDAHSDGHLSQLRTIVGKAIALQHGADIFIWQDIQAIPPGADWAASIERTINQTAFFIPIVTPRYLKSTQCLAELQSFRSRMEKLGRDDIIFPIQYVSVDHIALEDSVFGAEFERLHRHQWSDFRPLRHADPRSHEVCVWVDNLAEHILQVAVSVSKAESVVQETRDRELKLNPAPSWSSPLPPSRVVNDADEAERKKTLAKAAEDLRQEEEAARAADDARRRQAAAAEAVEAAESASGTSAFAQQGGVVVLQRSGPSMFDAQPQASIPRKSHAGVLAAALGGVALCVAAWFAYTRHEASHAPPVALESPHIVSPPASAVPAPAPVVPPLASVVPVPVPPLPSPPRPSASTDSSMAPPARAPDLQGSVDQILDSAALIISGRIVNLYGVRGVDGRPAKALQRYLESEGNVVQCYARDEAYQCFASGHDIAAHALRFGWARARQGAPSQYAAAEQDARRARSGIWGK